MIAEPPRPGVAANEGTGAVLPHTPLGSKTVEGAAHRGGEVTIRPWQQEG